MPSIEEQLRAKAAELLSAGKVELVIGYEAGSIGIGVRPAFISRAEDAERLVCNPLCGHNLATFLHRHKDKKAAIVAKPCDTRSLVGLIQERQIKRESLVILGVACEGAVNPSKVEELAPAERIVGLSIEVEKLIVETEQGRQEHPVKDLLSPGCQLCKIVEPVIADETFGKSQRAAAEGDEFVDARELAEKADDERWEDFRGEMSKCISCFTCRNACPSCYCTTCFVDASGPKWLGKTDDLSDVQIFHIMRMVHMAGRCTGCGACLRACPMNVNLQKYTGKIRLNTQEFFDFGAGDDAEIEAPLSTYSPSDPNDFFM